MTAVITKKILKFGILFGLERKRISLGAQQIKIFKIKPENKLKNQ